MTFVARQHEGPTEGDAGAVELGRPYDEDYYLGGHLGLPYHRGEPAWLAFFGAVADAIVGAVAPRTAFDAGCAIGLLVEALRARGVDAYGCDVSEYALSQVPEELRPYCRLGSVTEPLDRDYDVVTCIEVLEHLPEELAQQAVGNLTERTDAVLFSSTPDDLIEPTHLNVQPPEYWARLFAERGFYRDVDFDEGPVAAHAVLFRRGEPSPVELAARYERWHHERRPPAADEQLARERQRAERLEAEAAALRAVLARRSHRLYDSAYALAVRARRLARGGWRRQFRAWPGRKEPPPLVERLDLDYQAWRRTHAVDGAELRALARAQRRLAYRPVVSVLVPTYESRIDWLRAAIGSLRAQVYPRWQLCVADDGSRSRRLRAELLLLRLRHPRRFRVVRLRANGGIGAASAAALRLASGDFVTLLDHDDTLEPDALARVVERLNEEPDLDVLYSDEDKLDELGRRVQPFFKPDWSPDALLSVNYLGHLVAVRRALLERVGGFRSGFDGSQDYDLVLRATEATERIAHLPRVLYSWRITGGSTAGDTSAKPWAFEAAKRALTEALARRGVEGSVEDGRFTGSYRVRYAIRGTPRVSVVGPGAERLCGRTGYDGVEPACEPGGELTLLLGGECDPLVPGWLEALVEHAQREEVGAVGALLRGPDGEVVHEGVAVGMDREGGIAAAGAPYFGLEAIVRNCSAVAGCVLTRTSLLRELGGLDASLPPALAHVDYCLRLRECGYRVVYTPFAELRCQEPVAGDCGLAERLRGVADPYYNVNLSRTDLFRLASAGSA